MVSAVLLTATHSGKNVEYENILELVIPSSLRKDIQSIQEAFSMALEPKSPKSSLKSPRKTSLMQNNNENFGLIPKVLFPSNLSIESELEIEIEIEEIESFDIKLQEIQESNTLTASKTATYTDTISSPPSATTNDSLSITLQNEIKLLEIKLSEMEKLLKNSKELEIEHSETFQNLSETRLKLFESFEEMRQLKAKHEYEKIERNSFMASYDQERQNFDDKIEKLLSENDVNSIKLTELLTENGVLKEIIRFKDEKIQNIEQQVCTNTAERDHIVAEKDLLLT